MWTLPKLTKAHISLKIYNIPLLYEILKKSICVMQLFSHYTQFCDCSWVGLPAEDRVLPQFSTDLIGFFNHHR